MSLAAVRRNLDPCRFALLEHGLLKVGSIILTLIPVL